jgi:hypothetical protein
MSDSFGPWIIGRRTVGDPSFSFWKQINDPNARSVDDTDTVPPQGREYHMFQQTAVGHVTVPYNDVKLDVPGRALWVSLIGPISANTTRCSVTGTASDASGNIFVAGYFVEAATTSFVARFDSAGNQVWIIRLTASGPSSAADVQINNLALSPNGEIIVTGSFTATVTLNPGHTLTAPPDEFGRYWSQVFVASYDSSGNSNWEKGFGASGPDGGWSVACDSASDVYVLGNINNTFTVDSVTITAAGQGSFLVKINGSTHLAVWGKSVSSTGGITPAALAVDSTNSAWILFNGFGDATTPNGTILNQYAGNGPTTLFGVKFNSAGTQTVAKSLCNAPGGNAHVGAAIRATDNTLFITSGTQGSSFNGSSMTMDDDGGPRPCIFLAGVKSDGTHLMAYGYGYAAGNSGDNGETVCLTTDGTRIVFAGNETASSSAWNAPGGLPILVGNGGENLFVSVHGINSAGVLTFGWAYRISSDSSISYAASSCILINSFVILGGACRNVSDFNGVTIDSGLRCFVAGYSL